MVATSRTGRVLAIALLLTGLATLCVWYGTLGLDPAAGVYPGSEEIAAGYVESGEQVEVIGTVVETDPVVVEPVAGSAFGATRLTLTGISHPVEPGDRLRAFGTYRGDGRVAVEQSFTTPAWGLPYAVAVSFVGGLWVLFRLVRHWRVDIETLAVLPRRADEAIGGEQDG